METLRIIHAYEIGPPPGGECIDGIGVVVTSLCRELAKLGHNVTFLTGQTNPRSPVVEEADGFRLVRTDFMNALSRSWDPVRLHALRGLEFPLSLAFDGKAIQGRRYDIYNAHLYTAEAALLPLSRKARAPLVDTVHGTYAPSWHEVERNPWRRAVLSGAERFLVPSAAGMASLQVHAADYSRRMAIRWGAEGSRLLTIPNGVDVAKFDVSKAPRRPVPSVFTARRLVTKNGLDVLIRAVHLITRSIHIELTIAGTGPEEARLKELASSLGVSGSVKFVGPVPHSRIPRCLSSADLAVVPSFIEASSLFVLEAMAAKVPVVATAVGGISEVIRNGEDGILVRPGDPVALAEAMMLVLQNHSLAERLSSSARRRVAQEFSMGKMARRYLEAYRLELGAGA